MSHAKTLLLIDDQKPQILELHIRRQYSVSADDNIDHSLFQVFYCLFDLRRCAKPAHQGNIDREILHSLHKSVVMLLC